MIHSAAMQCMCRAFISESIILKIECFVIHTHTRAHMHSAAFHSRCWACISLSVQSYIKFLSILTRTIGRTSCTQPQSNVCAELSFLNPLSFNSNALTYIRTPGRTCTRPRSIIGAAHTEHVSWTLGFRDAPRGWGRRITNAWFQNSGLMANGAVSVRQTLSGRTMDLTKALSGSKPPSTSPFERKASWTWYLRASCAGNGF